MRRLFTYTYFCLSVIAIAVPANIARSFAAPPQQRDTTYNFFPKKKTKKSSTLTFTLPPMKAGTISNIKLNVPRPDDKLLNSVEVYPNPITDQINLRYYTSKNTNVTIKIVDVLGNDVRTLFSRRVDPGEQNGSFPIGNTLNKGFYFIRVVAGTESVIKRISIL
ncbi:T9SS type A sorting domain-containing protein [Mucilaginibacter calamicampi]|uniref:T9SS type A sorting domain-containing protein n=1 Tax=Mucilaginibacter calamicampi TaxID=1302352 RepID=A0ABW2Z0R1_9SPHI